MSENTISQVMKDELCTGCGMCAGICPKSAIEMIVDKKRGIHVPNIDEESCNNCGICVKVCPGHEVDFKALNLEIFGKEPEDILVGNYLNCYTGHATDYDIRYNSASGGLITVLLIYMLEEGIIDGALVTRTKKDNPLGPEPFIARTREEIIEAKGSKYCPVPANTALKKILEAEEGKKFAVVGLPCHLQALRKTEWLHTRLKERIILHFGLVCNHTPTFLATEYLLQRPGISRNQVNKIDYRGEGWPGQITIALKNGGTKRVPYFSEQYWGVAFQSFFYPTRCTMCIDKICQLADISFMDAWLPELSHDKIGKSMIVVRSQAARKFLQRALAAKIIELEEVSSNRVTESQSLALVRRRYSTRISLFKKFQKEVPIYDQPLSKVKMSDYVGAVLLYLRLYISERRPLWFLVNWYSVLWKLAYSSKQRLKAIKELLSQLSLFKRVN